MNPIKEGIRLTLVAALAVSVSLSLSACSDQSPLDPSAGENHAAESNLEKNNGKGKGKGKTAQDEAAKSYPQHASKVLDWDKLEKEYDGGTMKVANGSQFHIDSGSFTPPHGKKKSHEITMKVDRDEESGELIFTFGPSGSKFDPPAEIRLDWSDLGGGSKAPKLFYLKGHQRIEQTPDHIDVKNKKIILYVDHFSRYAVAH